MRIKRGPQIIESGVFGLRDGRIEREILDEGEERCEREGLRPNNYSTETGISTIFGVSKSRSKHHNREQHREQNS
jgi:hypothetical protein